MRTAICAALIALLTSSVTVLAQPGSLDLNFGGDGIVTTPITFDGTGQAVAVQPDGRILVVAMIPNTSTYDIEVLRYMPDGSMDNTFGTQGKTITSIASVSSSGVGIALQNDGRILVAHDVGGEMAVLRYTSSGTLDPSFGGDGVVSTDQSGTSITNSVAVQSDGKIVVAGANYVSSGSFALVRYNSDGSLDTSFSFDGQVNTAVSSQDNSITSMVITPDGSILAAGHVAVGGDLQTAVVKYMPDGTLDNSFGTNGIMQFPISGYNWWVAGSMELQADGRIVLGGMVENGTTYGFGAARLTANGTLDPTFGSGGTQATTVSGHNMVGVAMALQADGKMVITGSSDDDVALVRYATDGTVDFSFGTSGIVVTTLSTQDQGSGIAMQSDGKILVVGYAKSNPNDDILLLRYVSGVNVGIAEAEPLSGLKLYPDPARDHINISFPEPLSHQALLTLVNSTGQAVPLSSLAMQRSADGHECTIALSGMAPGPYLLRVVDGSAMRTLPFIKD